MTGIIRFIRSLFPIQESAWSPARTLPSWPEIVETMYKQSPSVSPDAELVKVIYSADREKRFYITKNLKYGFYQYQMEQLCPWDDEEWLFVSEDPDALPAEWTGFGNSGGSFFGTAQEAWYELVNSPEYKSCFDQ